MHFELYFACHPQAKYLYYLAKLGKSPNVTTLNAAGLSKKTHNFIWVKENKNNLQRFTDSRKRKSEEDTGDLLSIKEIVKLTFGWMPLDWQFSDDNAMREKTKKRSFPKGEDGAMWLYFPHFKYNAWDLKPRVVWRQIEESIWQYDYSQI